MDRDPAYRRGYVTAALTRRSLFTTLAGAGASQLRSAQQPQNPSPMVEHSRLHPRLPESSPAGERYSLELGTLLVPRALHRKASLPLLVHFHGAPWIAEVAAERRKMAVLTIALGRGSAVYAAPFRDSRLFGRLLREAESKCRSSFRPLTVSHWSAGYGSAREILSQPAYYDRIDRLLAIDSIHTGYVSGTPGPLESDIETPSLEVFLGFAKDAVAGKKRMIVTHSEIFPGTFASTTEVADYLVRALGLRRRPMLRWGPMGMQQISEARAARLLIAGYAGNTAPDHIDQLHALPDLLGML